MDETDIRLHRGRMRDRSREEAESIVKLAGFEVRHTWELANGYWPDAPSYDGVRSPWWLFLTEIGPVQVGWRKRVIHIQWDACAARGVVTTDDVTRGDTYVHAWTVEKAITYLRELRTLAQSQAGEVAKR